MTAQASHGYIVQEQYIILQSIQNCTLADGGKERKEKKNRVPKFTPGT
jgi:hypothetical protein